MLSSRQAHITSSYCMVFIGAHACPSSWASAGLALLQSRGIADFTLESGLSYRAYRVSISEQLWAMCFSLASGCCSSKSLPFPIEFIVTQHVCIHSLVHSCGAAWAKHFGMKSWSRSRIGANVLTPKGGRRSQARLQECTACGSRVADPYLHVWFYCAAWETHRASVLDLLPACPVAAKDRMRAMMCLAPGDAGFEGSVAFSHAVDQCASTFWKAHQ